MKPDLASLSLDELGDLKRSLDVAIYERVQFYRAAGYTWAQIAEFLRISTSEAHRRFRISKYEFPSPTGPAGSENQ